jgi:chromosome segregation ATPase
MLTFLGRIVGLVAIPVALVVLAACALGIALSWKMRDAWQAEAVSQVTHIEEGLGELQPLVQRASEFVEQARQQVGSLSKAVSAIRRELNEKGTAQTVVAKAAEAKFFELVNKAEEWVRSIKQTADTAQGTLRLVGALSGDRGETDSQKIRQTAQKLARISAALKDIAQWLDDLRDRKNLDQSVTRLSKLLEEVGGSLSEAGVDLNDFDQRVQRWQSLVTTTKGDLPFLMNLGLWCVTGLLGWLALSQVSVLVHGWRLLRGPRSDTVPPQPRGLMIR